MIECWSWIGGNGFRDAVREGSRLCCRSGPLESPLLPSDLIIAGALKNARTTPVKGRVVFESLKGLVA